MKKQHLDAVFISSHYNILYLTGFSGFSKEDRDAFLFITHDSQYIFTHGIYKEAAEKYIKTFDLVEMKRENPVSKSIAGLITDHKIKKMGIEDFDLTVAEYKNLLELIQKKMLKPTDVVMKLRLIKDSNEVKKMKKACGLGDNVYSQILKKIRIGVTEKEIAFEIDYLIRKNGAEPSFPTIVAFGANASFPHHVTSDKKLENNSFVLMDFGVRLNNYCSDMTRTLLFGSIDDEKRKAYQATLDAQKKAIQSLEEKLQKKQKVKGSAIDKVAREHITSQGFPTIPHSLGHGIGLEVHELPRLSPATDDALEDGMVFSIEPGVYLPGKFGIRIEDLYAIENNKLIPLTRSPKELTK